MVPRTAGQFLLVHLPDISPEARDRELGSAFRVYQEGRQEVGAEDSQDPAMRGDAEEARVHREHRRE